VCVKEPTQFYKEFQIERPERFSVVAWGQLVVVRVRFYTDVLFGAVGWASFDLRME